MGKEDKEPGPIRGRMWLIILGILGALILVMSIAVYHENSAMSVVGYFIGFVCILLGAVAVYDGRRK
ncbi:hypothetical protein [Alicyclobacillus fodiniaquatilis]|uniref:Uncharacterized protein n=1 Tax=Alicyclobacillus fodiniaquatilis TaxID=1661150 RepID=A0ABW4JJY9_9BACL